MHCSTQWTSLSIVRFLLVERGHVALLRGIVWPMYGFPNAPVRARCLLMPLATTAFASLSVPVPVPVPVGPYRYYEYRTAGPLRPAVIMMQYEYIMNMYTNRLQ
jgi:hypothetical protein